MSLRIVAVLLVFVAQPGWCVTPTRKPLNRPITVKPVIRTLNKPAVKPVTTGPSVSQAAQANQSITLFNNAVELGKSEHYLDAANAFKETIRLATPLISIYPQLKDNLGQAWALLGFNQETHSQTDQAVLSYQKALGYLKSQPPYATMRALVCGHLGTIFMLQNQLGKARPMFEQAIALNSDDVVTWQKYLTSMGNQSEQTTANYVTNLNTPFELWDGIHRQLRIYMASGPAAYTQEVKNAFNNWQQKLDGLFTFTYVTEPNEADCQILWVDKPSAVPNEMDHYTGGHNQKSFINDVTVTNDIYLSLTTLTGNARTIEDMFSTAQHEIGHMLGINGHSPSPGDVMVASTPESHIRRPLTPRDIATVKALYADDLAAPVRLSPPAIPLVTFAQYQQQLEAAGKRVENKQLAEAQQMMEAAMQLYPNYPLAPVMLSDVYIRQGNFAKAKVLLAPWANGKHPWLTQVQANYVVSQIKESYEFANKGHWDLAKPKAKNTLENMRVVMAQSNLSKSMHDYFAESQANLNRIAQYQPNSVISYGGEAITTQGNADGKKKHHWWDGSNYTNQAPVYIPMPSRW